MGKNERQSYDFGQQYPIKNPAIEGRMEVL